MAFYSETQAEKAFRDAGSIFHVCTKPLESDVLFYNDDERKIALNFMALARYEAGCSLLAFSVMTNHFHFILMGEKEQALKFYECFFILLSKYFSRHGRSLPASSLEPGFVPIEDIKQFRAEIAYVLRNAFVVNPDVNVFADPCSCGFLYFNPLLEQTGVPAASLKGRALRAFTKSRIVMPMDPSLYVRDDVAQPWSFVDYKKVETFYDNARQFVNSILKNVEAQVEVALRYGEVPSLSDDEMWPIVFSLCRKEFRVEKPSHLADEGRKRLAILLKNRYFSSNKQLARLTGLPLKELDAMYPLFGTSK